MHEIYIDNNVYFTYLAKPFVVALIIIAGIFMENINACVTICISFCSFALIIISLINIVKRPHSKSIQFLERMHLHINVYAVDIDKKSEY